MLTFSITMLFSLFVVRLSAKFLKPESVTVTKGEEKGFFEFGGSTILLLLEKDKVKLCDDLLKNTREGFETKLLQGSVLGESLK